MMRSLTRPLAATLLLAVMVGCGAKPCQRVCDKVDACGQGPCTVLECPADPALEQCFEDCFESASCEAVSEYYRGGDVITSTDEQSVLACLDKC